MILCGQEGVRPSRRGQQSHAPRTFRHDSRGRGSHIKKALRTRRRRIRQDFAARIRKVWKTTVLGYDVTTVTIDRERHDRVREPLALVIQKQNRIGKCMAERMMQRLVGVRRVESLLEQFGREVSCRLGLSIQMKFMLRRLVPNVLRGRTEIDRIISIYAIRRDYVFPEILVLVVAPDQDEVGL